MAPDRAPTLAALVVNWNTGELAVRAISRVLEAESSVEVVVVDNASSDGSVETLNAAFGLDPRVRVVANPTNLMYAAANNRAYELTSAPIVMLLNPDAIPGEGVVDEMVSIAASRERIGLVAGQLRKPDGGRESSYYEFPTVVDTFFLRTAFGHHLDRVLFRGRNVARATCSDRDFSVEVRDVMPSAACVVTTRTAIERSGGLFDEHFPLFYNDVDLCARLRSAGLDVVVVPGLEISHIGAASVSKLSNRELYSQLYDSAYHFFQKHRSRSASIAVWFVCRFGQLTNPVVFWVGRGKFQRGGE